MLGCSILKYGLCDAFIQSADLKMLTKTEPCEISRGQNHTNSLVNNLFNQRDVHVLHHQDCIFLIHEALRKPFQELIYTILHSSHVVM